MRKPATSPKLHPSLRDTFVPLPSSIDTPLTPEQLAAVFPNKRAWSTLIEIIQQQQQHNTESDNGADDSHDTAN